MNTDTLLGIACGFLFLGLLGIERFLAFRRPANVHQETWQTYLALCRTYKLKIEKPVLRYTNHVPTGFYWNLSTYISGKSATPIFSAEGYTADLAVCDCIKQIMRFDWNAYDAAYRRLRIQSESEASR